MAGEISLPDSPDAIACDDAEGVRRANLWLIGEARRSVDIVSRYLDPALYDTEEFCAALRTLIVGTVRARIRILVLEPGPVVARGHRLVELAQRLTSFIQIRVPSPQHQDLSEAWLVVDDRSYLHRRTATRFEATGSTNSPRDAGRLTARFEEIWALAQPDANLRRLYL